MRLLCNICGKTPTDEKEFVNWEKYRKTIPDSHLNYPFNKCIYIFVCPKCRQKVQVTK